MTTNITALAQRLKVAAKNGCCHTLFPDDCLALVEALEKAQQTEKTLESRNRRLDGIITAAEKHIADLESRAVTVENLQESAYRAGLTPGWNLGLANNNEGFNKCLAAHAAGIKVNFEGEQNTQPLSEAERAGPQERRKAERDTEPYGFTDGDRRGMIYKPEHADRLSEPVPLYRHAQPAPEYPETLPCPVLLEPGLRFSKGIKTSTMLAALARRAVHESDMAALSPEERVEFQARIEDFKALIAQPAPVVPKSISVRQAISALESAGAVTTIGQAYKMGWNACRAAMLQELKKSAGAESICRSDENVQVLHTKSPAQSDCCPAQNVVAPAQSPIDHGYLPECECAGCKATARICTEMAVNSLVIPDEMTSGQAYEIGYYYGDPVDVFARGANWMRQHIIDSTLAAAPQAAPVVPKEMTAGIAVKHWEGGRGSIESFIAGYNFCRAAMLAAAPQSHGSEPATVPGKWIPVSERMPEDDDFVYIWPRPDFGVELHVGQYCERSHKGGGWYAQVYEQNYGIEWHPITVTHWMPLPAAPQEVK